MQRRVLLANLLLLLVPRPPHQRPPAPSKVILPQRLHGQPIRQAVVVLLKSDISQNDLIKKLSKVKAFLVCAWDSYWASCGPVVIAKPKATVDSKSTAKRGDDEPEWDDRNDRQRRSGGRSRGGGFQFSNRRGIYRVQYNDYEAEVRQDEAWKLLVPLVGGLVLSAAVIGPLIIGLAFTAVAVGAALSAGALFTSLFLPFFVLIGMGALFFGGLTFSAFATLGTALLLPKLIALNHCYTTLSPLTITTTIITTIITTTTITIISSNNDNNSTGTAPGRPPPQSSPPPPFPHSPLVLDLVLVLVLVRADAVVAGGVGLGAMAASLFLKSPSARKVKVSERRGGEARTDGRTIDVVPEPETEADPEVERVKQVTFRLEAGCGSRVMCMYEGLTSDVYVRGPSLDLQFVLHGVRLELLGGRLLAWMIANRPTERIESRLTDALKWVVWNAAVSLFDGCCCCQGQLDWYGFIV
ncbi:hypothetical protein VOLCADRAFT_107485 [Volvox carteri f. nagariensis]|uniref:Oleosin n=1 Tax=Volvox carteri f. nagariensis TaxID=3068 RepID=D8UE96_VOLCA|nr:uncharacterized protein VOLCADRAFT_107485 [Volvox carteri f. nagariensis]EFJ41930.1 hypothetical protein VOLCADRAFT_107485 [Volvox carteri f. nagariensis]|eukprot:XP_002956967.1 hypothetical protein VOLCADRAFT_107485 [Volvox carteri f. nagariensis]